MPGLHTDTLLAGRYRLGPLLGRGGMAEVYDGFDERLQRPVAVKVLRPPMAANPRIRGRFEAEARSAARLSHPNVVAVYDTGEDAGLPFLVMERLPGETLADRLATGPVEVDWALRVAGDVLTALRTAHDAGTVHRDVKPGNVLIAADGCAKVADFGIAKSLDVDGTVDLTETNQVVGTPAYLAPERITGEPATPQSDLYAVGVMLYEALAGAKPFEGPNAVAVAYAIRHEDPEPLAARRADLDPAVAAAVHRAMAREPSRRFASAADMAAALGVALGPVAAPMPAVMAAAAGGGAAGPVTDPDATVDGGAAQAPTVADCTDVLPVAPAAGPTVAGPLPAGPRRRLPPRTRSRALVTALVAGLVLVLAATLLGSEASAPPPDPRAALASDLRLAATRLEPADGRAWEDARERLGELAAAVESGAGGQEATALLGRLAEWRDDGSLSGTVVERLRSLVLQVPGVDANAVSPPTTAPVVVEAGDDGPAPGPGPGAGGRGKGRGKGKKGG